jgi:hypothetical protein
MKTNTETNTETNIPSPTPNATDVADTVAGSEFIDDGSGAARPSVRRSEAGEQFAPAVADRAPTAAEDAAAETAARSVDLDRVAEHAERANKLGAAVKGEGEIEPSNDA